ncbi:endonuclease/exonuclease/phosphatase family protein [Mycoplasmopsis columbina]|uniref:endonuclease/exonuclease/phosphatase family protein n=1 Tax=Mycoplasmopsis columbina TaxID=114881 RepID=UPI003A7F4837
MKALSKIINYLNIDVQGIVELFNPEALIELVKELNTLNTEANWKYVISDYDKGGKNVLLESNSKQHELSGFIYKASKLDAIAFDNNLIGTSYDNSNYKPHFNSDSNLGFVRPPFGVKFKTKGSEKNDFTFVIGHFDSPGVSKENQEVSHKKQGTQELDEAWNLNAAMNWYDHIDGNNNELIFMGDTNIKKNNEALAFEPLLVQNNYKSLLKEDNPTSIGRNFNYSEPYDKIFYKGDLEVTNSDKYDLLAFPESGLWENISSFQEWKNFLQKNDYDYKTETSYISSVISDHAPIYTDLLLNKADLT